MNYELRIKSLNFFVLIPLFLILIVLFFLSTPSALKPALAQCLTQTTEPRVQNGLISTPSFSGTNKFGNLTGECVNSNLATFVPYRIPGYNDLKSIYFTQSKVPNPTTNTSTNMAAVTDGYIYNYTNTNAAGVSVGTYSYAGTAVIFVDNNLLINGNITGSADVGLVFVTGGDIIIAPGVTQIDAVLISAGNIYTAGAGCSLAAAANPGTSNQLVINGSLISLDSNKPISFCRKLFNNIQAAEQINQQPKYLVILRNIFSDTLQKWSEIQ